MLELFLNAAKFDTESVEKVQHSRNCSTVTVQLCQWQIQMLILRLGAPSLSNYSRRSMQHLGLGPIKTAQLSTHCYLVTIRGGGFRAYSECRWLSC